MAQYLELRDSVVVISQIDGIHSDSKMSGAPGADIVISTVGGHRFRNDLPDGVTLRDVMLAVDEASESHVDVPVLDKILKASSK